MKKSTNLLFKASAAPLVLALASISTPAFAQSADAEASEEGGNDIVVTGSRIQRRDLDTSSPIAVVTNEEFTLSGSVNVESVINTLPQVVPGATSFSNNPGGGVATLNLRGLGATRNLVLVNGRRYIFYDASQIVDLNTIPSFLIDSVDVVTGGASAVYGSDAVAGVINFRLRNDLNGIIAGAQYNITDEGDGQRYNAYVAMGSDFADGRGNIAVYAEYQNRGSIGQGDRDFSRFTQLDGATGLTPGGSGGVPQGRFVQPATLAIGIGSSCGGAGQPPRNAGCFSIAEGTNYPGAGAFFANPGASRPYGGNAVDGFNYAPSNFLMVPQERWTLGGYGEYEVADGINVYTEVNYINNRVENELAATPLTQNVDFNIAAITPLVSAADLAQLNTIAARQQAAIAAAATPGCAPITTANPTGVCANPYAGFTAGTGQFGALQPGFVRLQVNSRFTQIANRNVADDRNAFRILIGTRGDITEGLTYDAYYMYSRTRNASIQEGNVSRSAFTRLAGNGTCNPFGLNQYSQACIDGVSILAQNTDISTLEVFQGSIAGNLFETPWANGDSIGFAAGVEYRKVFGQFIPDTALQSGDVVGFNAGQSTEGGYNVAEVFGEIRIPVISEDFVHLLELTAAGRYSDYSLENVGGVYTYAGGVRFAPIRDIEFRANYQRAVRAPNVQQLFGGISVGFPPATDPCALATANTNAAIRAVCIATGVPAASVGQAFLQPNSQIQGAFGGNPNLQEEVADTFTAGVVLRPSFIPRLNITVDYYDIEIQNAVAVAGGGVNGILNLCYNVVQDANGPICALVNRDAQGILSGPPFVVSAGNANLASLATSGVDVQVDYNMPLGFSIMGGDESNLSFSFLLNYSDENDFVPTVGVDDTVECAGRFGLNCGNPTPRWKWTSRLSLVDGPMTLTGRWRHTGAVRDDDDETDFIVENIGSYDLFDLALAFDVNDNFTVNIGVNNLFDVQPPIIGSNAEQANTYPGVYDVLGRDFFISGQLRF